MKKTLTIITGISLILSLFTGCSTRAPQSQPMETQTDTQATQSAQNASAEATHQAPDTSSFIGEEKAKEIALTNAGLNAGEVVFDKVELDKDDGIWQYEIEFRKERTEYDADIKADDGTILSWEVDLND